MTAGEPRSVEYRFRRDDGEVVFLRATVAVIFKSEAGELQIIGSVCRLIVAVLTPSWSAIASALRPRAASCSTPWKRIRAAVERLTGRKVLAFISGNHVDSDIAAELFILEEPL